MTPIVGRLRATLLKRNELVAEIDERHRIALASKLEIEQAAVEGQRLFDIADLKRHMIETNQSRFCLLRHESLQSPFIHSRRDNGAPEPLGSGMCSGFGRNTRMSTSGPPAVPGRSMTARAKSERGGLLLQPSSADATRVGAMPGGCEPGPVQCSSIRRRANATAFESASPGSVARGSSTRIISGVAVAGSFPSGHSETTTFHLPWLKRSLSTFSALATTRKSP